MCIHFHKFDFCGLHAYLHNYGTHGRNRFQQTLKIASYVQSKLNSLPKSVLNFIKHNFLIIVTRIIEFRKQLADCLLGY